jgi:hypothetical protein
VAAADTLMRDPGAPYAADAWNASTNGTLRSVNAKASLMKKSTNATSPPATVALTCDTVFSMTRPPLSWVNAVTCGGCRSVVVKENDSSAPACARPETSVARATRTVYCVSSANGRVGVNTTTVLPRMVSILPSTAPWAEVTTRAGPLNRVGSIASEYFTRTVVLTETPVADASGVVSVIAGGSTSSVVNDATY